LETVRPRLAGCFGPMDIKTAVADQRSSTRGNRPSPNSTED
jgi:hypothetical protein